MTLKRLLKAIALPALLLLSLQLVAQDKVVTGKVTDSKDGTGVPGVSVVAKGSKSGTQTDANGNFRITVGPNVKALTLSSVGFASQDVDISNSTDVNVAMVATSASLNEVVVTGYGTQRRREVTSAIATVKAESFNKGNITDVGQLLQGKVAGLSVSRPGGDPNAGFTLRLRGLSTIGQNTGPLIVLDGLVGADINSVDPNDIKSFDILKDGSAAAIYGTRGSQGVIIITTKTGSRNNSTVTYNGSVSAEVPGRFLPHMTAAEFRALGKGVDYGASTDWNKEITRTAISHTHNIGFAGGAGNTSYSASVNFRNQEGVAIRTGFNQLNGRLNLMQKALRDKMTFNVNLNMLRRDANLGFPDAFKYAAIYNPTSPIYSSDPTFDLGGAGYFEVNAVDYSNPYAMLVQNSHDAETQKFNLTVSGDYEFFKGLKGLVRYGQQTTSYYEQSYFPRTAWISRNFLGQTGVGRKGYAYKNDNETFSQLFEATLTYDHSFDKLNLNAVGGYSYQDFLNQGYNLQGGNFVTDLANQTVQNAADFVDGKGAVSSYKNGSRLVAFFGRVNLNWNNLAYVSASLRREGSTMFGTNNKWGYFPAVSAGLDIAKIAKLDMFNNLKFRASYGVTGSLPPLPGLSIANITGSNNYFYTQGAYLASYGPNKNANPDLKWERKTEIDFGLDFTLLNNRLTGTVDYYNRNTSDLIFPVTVPVPPNFVPTKYLNIGTLASSGFELTLGYDIVKNKDFTWNASGNFSTYNTVLKSLDPSLAGSYVGATNLGTPGQESTQITRAVVGQKVGMFWGNVYEGVDKDGKYIFKDLNGDGKAETENDNDKTYIGNGLPKFEWGLANTLKWKNWDFNIFIRGSVGHDIINTNRAFYENPNVATTYNPTNSKYFNPDLTDGQKFSSLFVEKGSFAKIDNATLGYNFKLGQGSWVRSFRLYLTGQNLWTITKYTGVDPEVRYTDGNPPNVLAPGIDRRETWVYTRTFTFGLNLGF